MPIADDDRVNAVRVLARLCRLLEASDSGLTLPQYRVLAALAQGGVRSAHLAARLAVRGPTLTAIADTLVATGYATRESEPGDRRVVKLRATDAGIAALHRADLCYLDRLAPILADIEHGERIVADLATIGGALDDRLKAKLPDKRPGNTRAGAAGPTGPEARR